MESNLKNPNEKLITNNQTKVNDLDHRLIGKKQKLFFFHEYSPGSCFFYPHGTIIYNKLVDFIKTNITNAGLQKL